MLCKMTVLSLNIYEIFVKMHIFVGGLIILCSSVSYILYIIYYILCIICYILHIIYYVIIKFMFSFVINNLSGGLNDTSDGKYNLSRPDLRLKDQVCFVESALSQQLQMSVSHCNIVTSDHTMNELPVVVEHALRSLYISSYLLFNIVYWHSGTVDQGDNPINTLVQKPRDT